MKKSNYLLLSLLLGILITVSCSNEKPDKNPLVVIEGTGYSEAFNQVTLKYFDHNTLSYKAIESQLLTADDAFKFIIPFESPNLYELNFDEKEMIPVSVENATVISVQRVDKQNKIEGSASSQKAASFREKNDQLQAKYFGQLKIDFDQAMAENDQEKIKELTLQSEILVQDFLKEFRNIITDMGTTPAAYYALQFSDFNKEIDFIETRLAAFKKEAPDSYVTKALQNQVNLAKGIAIGSTPPPFEVKDKEGELIALSEFKGKIVLIDFWASWCRACRIENPKFAALYKKYSTEPFDIISISQDDSKEKWSKAIEKDGIQSWTHIYDTDKAISKQYSISSLPQNLLLNEEGQVIAKNITAEELTSILSAI